MKPNTAPPEVEHWSGNGWLYVWNKTVGHCSLVVDTPDQTKRFMNFTPEETERLQVCITQRLQELAANEEAA